MILDVGGNERKETGRRTSNFLFAQPSSSAGNSTLLSNSRARKAPSGSSNSAKPNPWGLFAGVIRRLKDLIGPQAYHKEVSKAGWRRKIQTRTERSWFKKLSWIPPDIDPTNKVVNFWFGGTKCICCCCARADIEGPCPYDGRGGRRPSPIRFGMGCILA